MSSREHERKRANFDESPSKREAAKRSKVDEAKSKMSDAELFNLEVEESKNRDKDEDLQTFKALVGGIKESLSSIRQLKKAKDASSALEVANHRIFTSLAIARLRKLNRLAHLRSARAKETTSEKRSKNDQYHLQLQNLQYEVGHLQKEINKCLEFRSKDEELNLVSVEDFYAEAPEDISRRSVTEGDVHEQRKARLQWELEQRKRLAKQLEEAKVQLEKSQADIQTREANLESLGPRLGKILEATKPVQEYLGMPLEHQREQFQLARHLPQPLFVLYRNLNALESQDKKGHLRAVIEGDAEAARLFAFESAPKDVDSDSDQEEERRKVSKHRRRALSKAEEDVEYKVLKTHPLNISLQLVCSRSDGKLPSTQVKVELNFYYMVAMDMVTVKGSLTEQISVSSIASGDLMQMEAVLNCVCSGDKGEVTPSPLSQSQLERLKPSHLSHYLPKIGKPYRWAQTISGLGTLTSDVTEPKLSSVGSLVKKIKHVVLDRVEMVHQITDLERCNLAVPYMKTDIIPKSLPSTSLYHWSRVTYEDFCTLPHAADFVKTETITSESTIYLAKMVCGPVKVLAHVLIANDYPASRPLILVRLEHQKLGSLTRLNSNDVLAIEEEMNLGKSEETDGVPNQLNLQLVRLGWCCDVFVAINSLAASQHDLVKLKFIPNCHRGRERQLPLTYNSDTGFFGHD